MMADRNTKPQKEIGSIMRSNSPSNQNLNKKRKAEQESESVHFSKIDPEKEKKDVDFDTEASRNESITSKTVDLLRGSSPESAVFANDADEFNDACSADGKSVKPPRTPVLTEGSITHKIKVGIEHQAIIPQLGSKHSPYIRIYPPELVWVPGHVSDLDIDKFIADAGEILKGYMKVKCITNTRYVPYNIDIKHLNSPRMQCREFNLDQILKVLHDQDYNTSRALQVIEKTPEQYLFLWTKEEKLLYDLGFKKHYNDIRYITNELGPQKNHRDVVDYFYRFKIPDQFRIYQDQKRDQARKILECVEQHKRNEYLCPEDNLHVENTIGSKKLAQLWAKTGGGHPDDVGATERRFLDAKEFLLNVKDMIGHHKYLELVNLLKALNSRVLTIPQVRDGFSKLLNENQRHLLQRFEAFLPEQFRETP